MSARNVLIQKGGENAQVNILHQTACIIHAIPFKLVLMITLALSDYTRFEQSDLFQGHEDVGKVKLKVTFSR